MHYMLIAHLHACWYVQEPRLFYMDNPGQAAGKLKAVAGRNEQQEEAEAVGDAQHKIARVLKASNPSCSAGIKGM
jgi:hypothetical protein